MSAGKPNALIHRPKECGPNRPIPGLRRQSSFPSLNCPFIVTFS